MDYRVEEDYFVERVQTSLEMARRAASSAARLIHLELAGRYSLALARLAMKHPRARGLLLRPGDTSFYMISQGLSPVAK